MGLSIINTYSSGTGDDLNIVDTSTDFHDLDFEFDTSLKVEIMINAGAGTMQCRTIYQLDTF